MIAEIEGQRKPTPFRRLQAEAQRQCLLNAPLARVAARSLIAEIGAGSVWVIVQRNTGEIWRVDPTTGSVNTIPVDARYPLDLAVAERREEAWVVDSTGALVRVNPDIDLAVARIRTASTIHSALAVGGGSVWVAVQD